MTVRRYWLLKNSIILKINPMDNIKKKLEIHNHTAMRLQTKLYELSKSITGENVLTMAIDSAADNLSITQSYISDALKHTH